uniref:Mt-merlin n=1 Tax=Molgula tectiformis TaxID=30286 RepID=A4F2N5_MOLTE|nr:Mt-merlin [Molgula tectiformis]
MTLFRKRNKTINVCISTFDADLEFVVKSTAKGRAIFDLVCQTIGLRETWYFGLSYQGSHRQAWVKPNRQLIKHDISRTNEQYQLQFLAKFYPETVADELIQEITRHLFFLQIQDSILLEDLYCPPENAILLASYALQAKYGDYDIDSITHETYCSTDYLPKRVKDQFQMSEQMWGDKINEWYAQHRGLTRDEAELEYLKIALDLEMFGVSLFKIKNNKGSELCLGINAVSVNVYEPDNQLLPIVSFQWSELADMSFSDNKFVIKQSSLPTIRSGTLRRGATMSESSENSELQQNKDFVFFTDEPGVNKIILDLCRGNHDLFMKRRKVDSMEIQQMKTQAKEEKARKLAEKHRLVRDKEQYEQIEMEREELKQRVKELQEESRMAMEALNRSEETAKLLAEKAQIAEEETVLLKKKANHAEQEMQRIKAEFAKTQEANIQLQQNLQNYDQVTKQLAEDSKTNAAEAEKLRKELKRAMQAKNEAKEKLTNASMVNSNNTSTDMSYGHYIPDTPGMASTPLSNAMGESVMVTGASVSPLQIQPLAPGVPIVSHKHIGSNGSKASNGSIGGANNGGIGQNGRPGNVGMHKVGSNGGLQTIGGDYDDSNGDFARVSEMQHLSQEIEKERMEYQAKSKHIEQQLAMLKTEIEGLKVDEKMTPLDHMYTENSLKGAVKYQSLNQAKESTPEQRLQLYNKL